MINEQNQKINRAELQQKHNNEKVCCSQHSTNSLKEIQEISIQKIKALINTSNYFKEV